MKTNLQNHPENVIREACAEDAGSILALIQQLAAEDGGDIPLTEGYVLHYLCGTDRHILLAQCGSEVTGLLSYSTRADLFHAGNSVLIEELVVHEGSGGRGIGSELLSSLLEKLPRLACREVCLAVMPGNERAIRFYKRHGLVEEALFLERHFQGEASIIH